ncbi:MAG: pyridoxal phosphate-dependent aminotransferase [Nanoarchaeota archaeon]|nr:pyridoxal phosphate-dependent aminotransferase [Nanoarchaeota archaeon]
MGRLSDLSRRLKGQEMFTILAEANELERSGKEIIHFELGDPHFSTPKNITDACKIALDSEMTHYAPSMGLRELRILVIDKINHERGFKPNLEQVLISAGANVQLHYALACSTNPGEEVIVPDPGFVSYYSILDKLGIKAKRVPTYEENEFRLNPEDVREAITSKTRMIIINSPNNPTGAVMNEEEIKEIYNLAKEKDIYLLTDEIYSKIIYDGLKFSSPSIYDECKERTIIIDGFSKEYAMTGWRLGYAIGPKDIITKMGLTLETESSCVPPFIQRAGMEALTGSQKIINKRISEYHQMRDAIVNGLNTLQGVSCLNPRGAFYVFPNITETGMTSREFYNFMLNKAGVALAPGDIFGKQGEGYARLSYSTELSNIQEAIGRMDKALKNR